MKFLPRLLGLGLFALLTLLVMACESSKTATTEFGSPNRIKGDVIAKPESRLIVQLTDTATNFKVPRAELASAFIRQFGDGTVVDKILVRKAPGSDANGKYYLIGMGLRGGMYRAMALPLTSGGENTYYLRPSAERYVITSTGCPTCLFEFEEERIVSAECAENSGGGRCDLKVMSNNELFIPQVVSR
ncbi:hypothetical protein GCM10023185_46830 [Hymenobacter saemangeumensis]|uniref:Lipoprotein n=1 Tax=Hymenobacter saemangeumensis TaxID=1084522 RepID=A0ABP8IT27_9BACT